MHLLTWLACSRGRLSPPLRQLRRGLLVVLRQEIRGLGMRGGLGYRTELTILRFR
jgi:hypothetical protein